MVPCFRHAQGLRSSRSRLPVLTWSCQVVVPAVAAMALRFLHRGKDLQS